MVNIKGPQAPAPSPRSLREIFTFIKWLPNLLELKKGGLHSRYKKGGGGGGGGEKKNKKEKEKGRGGGGEVGAGGRGGGEKKST